MTAALGAAESQANQTAEDVKGTARRGGEEDRCAQRDLARARCFCGEEDLLPLARDAM